MSDVLTLAFPFFGLILLGFVCGKLMQIPEEGLRWMNFFIIYVALPCLFYKLVAATPFDELKNWPFVIGTTLSTYLAFCISLGVGLWASKGDLRPATIQAVLGSYSNIGYMGPGLTLAALGSKASVPTALIFVFDNALLFTLVPLLIAMGGSGKLNVLETTRLVVWRVVSHPFNIAIAVAVTAAYFEIRIPTPVDTMVTYLRNAAAPVALFTLGVTVALRPLTSVPMEVPIHLVVKLLVHPVIVLVLLSVIGGFEREWVFAAVLMAALPPALNVFVLANQYNVYVERSSAGVLVGTLVSTLTVTGLLYLIATDTIPYSLFGR